MIEALLKVVCVAGGLLTVGGVLGWALSEWERWR